jgi:hypothetical protein
LYHIAHVSNWRPRANQHLLNKLGQEIADLQEEVRDWVQLASNFRDNPEFSVKHTDIPFAEADFLHEMIKLTSAIEHTRERLRTLALEHRFIFQLIGQQVSFNIALLSVGLSLLFGAWSIVAPVTSGDPWQVVGGIGWGIAAGVFAANYTIRTLF